MELEKFEMSLEPREDGIQSPKGCSSMDILHEVSSLKHHIGIPKEK